MLELNEILQQAVTADASDIFLVAGTPATAKVDGHLRLLNSDRLLPMDTVSLLKQIYQEAGRDFSILERSGDDDFSFARAGMARFRVNAYRQRGSFAAVIRVVCFSIPDYRELGIPEQVMNIAGLKHGMVLFTGTAGSGKSTTQACIIDRINKTRDCHIVTLEDPIEYLHRNDKSIVSQREIAIDTKDSLSGLRACLRQTPDIILLGEMRDHETIRTAMTAAETGHLILTTLHTNGAVNAVDRIIDEFPAGQQDQIRAQLSSVLCTVVSQRLIPDVSGGRVAAFEIMNTNSAVRTLIRENRTYLLKGTIETGREEGMVSADQSVFALFRDGKITEDTALSYADDPEQMQRRIASCGQSDLR